MDYRLIPNNEQLKRKVDYFYLPYNPTINLEKHMVFSSTGGSQSSRNKV